ncbi:MAG: hypothetical protein A2539_04425 [Elusimicrobia bacterium RIFOXYD2_FULL_34_15]|nr:MAG: hypothetical protein A2539_04425 [Elusimicrobia bacterium RIFOXYD2_FULL_34_15]
MKKAKVLLLFSILVLFFFYDIIFTDKMYLFRDILNLFMPYRLFAAENIQNGTVPIWNPYSFFGQPFLANPETSLFYPFTILFYLFKFTIAYKVFVILHFYLASIFFYFLAKTLKIKNSYAIFGSICWAFGGYLITRVEFLSILGAAIWLPLALIFLMNKNKILLGLVFVMQIFAGHPQIIFYTILLLLFFLKKNIIYTFIFSIFFALFLSSIQIIPSFEFIRSSNRAKGITYQEASSVSISPAEIIKNILPMKNIDITGNFWLKSFYVGLIPLIFIFTYFFNSDKKLLLPLIVILILALGRNTPVYEFLYKYLLPFSRIRYPAAIMFLFSFIICLMISKSNIYDLSKFTPLFIILTIFDLYLYSYKLNPKISSEFINIKTKNILNLQKNTDDGKYLVLPDVYSNTLNYYDFINTLPANVNIPHHIFNASGYDPLTTEGIETFVEKLKNDTNAKELSKYNIKYVITNKNIDNGWRKLKNNIFENKYYNTSISINPQTFRPCHIYFLVGICLTIFSTVFLALYIKI